jgi:hypothetical protein
MAQPQFFETITKVRVGVQGAKAAAPISSLSRELALRLASRPAPR